MHAVYTNQHVVAVGSVETQAYRRCAARMANGADRRQDVLLDGLEVRCRRRGRAGVVVTGGRPFWSRFAPLPASQALSKISDATPSQPVQHLFVDLLIEREPRT